MGKASEGQRTGHQNTTTQARLENNTEEIIKNTL